jgi:hypothetical protein
MNFRLLAIGVALVGAGRLPAAPAERKTFQFGDFTIEAPDGDEPYVEALAVQLADFKLPPPPAPPTLKLSWDDLDRRRDYFLGRIAAQLGLARPTALMASAYDGALKARRVVAPRAPAAVLRRFVLYRGSAWTDLIASGEAVPGDAGPDGAGERSFDFDLRRNLAGEGGRLQSPEVSAQIEAAWQGIKWPVRISEGGGAAPDADAAESLARLRKFYISWSNEVLADTLRTEVHAVLREAVEAGVVWQYLTSKDRRWFCEGVAGYVADRIIAGEVGNAEARLYRDLDLELKSHARLVPQIDLEGWPAVEDSGKPAGRVEVDAANEAFATKVIASVCAKHGDALLPALFQQIGRTPREKASMATVFKAFKRLTGEDLRTYLPKAPAKA